MAKSPAWTRKEGKNPEGGLNEKGRASLRAAGHDIKRPQPEGGSRRDSFCARMKGMKAKLTSSETANDPDSRINKSLRKWNCADGGAIDVARQYRQDGGEADLYAPMPAVDTQKLEVGGYQKMFPEEKGEQLFSEGSRKTHDIAERNIAAGGQEASNDALNRAMLNSGITDPVDVNSAIRAAEKYGRSSVIDPEGRKGNPLFVAGTTPEGKNVPLNLGQQAMLAQQLARVYDYADPSDERSGVTTFNSGKKLPFGLSSNSMGRNVSQSSPLSYSLPHEIGHAIHNYQYRDKDPLSGASPNAIKQFNEMAADRLKTEYSGREKMRGYSFDPREQFAEGVKAYLTDPAKFKMTNPDAAKFLRDTVNTDPRINKILNLSREETMAPTYAKNGGAIDVARQYRNGYATGGNPTPGASPYDYSQNINDMFQFYLGRPAAQSGLQFWQNELQNTPRTMEDLQNALLNSQEAQNRYGDIVNSIYQQELGRDALQGGKTYWANQLQANRGAALDQLYEQLNASPEYRLNQIFQNELGRNAAQAGRDYWMNRINTGQSNWDQVEDAIMNSQEAKNRRDNIASDATRNTRLFNDPDSALAAMMWSEGDILKNQAKDANMAIQELAGIGWTARNRAASEFKENMSKSYRNSHDPKSIVDQIYAPSAYSHFSGNREKLAQRAFNDNPELKQYYMDLAHKINSGQIEDPTQGAISYYNPKVVGTPGWAGRRGQREGWYKTTDLGIPQATGGQYHVFYGSNKYTPIAVAAYPTSSSTATASAGSTGTSTGVVAQDNAQAQAMAKYNQDKAAYDQWVSATLGDLAAQGRPLVLPSNGPSAPPSPGTQEWNNRYLVPDNSGSGTQSTTPTLPQSGTTTNLGQDLASQGAGGNISGGGMYNPGGGTIGGTTGMGTQGPTFPTWQPEAPPLYPSVLDSTQFQMGGLTYGIPGGSGSGAGWGTGGGYSGGGGGGGGSFGGGGGMSVGSGGFSVGFKSGGAVDSAVDIARSYRKSGGPVWNKPRPKSLGKPQKLTPGEKSSAKAAAKAAGRPYPNLVDNMRAAREDGGRLSPFMEAKIRDIGDAELGKYGIGPNAPSSTKDELKAGPEQSTWESIASKAMGDRPSPERRRFVEGMGDIADIGHVGAYATPLAPYIGAADFARGVASGDPMEAALGATGLPGKGAKAVGAAASAMMPDEAQASSLSSAIRAMERAREMFGKPSSSDAMGVFHSLNQNRIPALKELGGLPAPSLAITKPQLAPTEFGDTLLVGRPHLAVPSEKNIVHGSDMFSPTFPRTELVNGRQMIVDPGPFRGKPLTMGSAVKQMASGPIRGAEKGTEGASGRLIMNVNKPFNSLEELMKSRHRLPDDRREHFEGLEDLNRNLDALGGMLHQYQTDPARRDYSHYLSEAINAKLEHGPEAFSKYYKDIAKPHKYVPRSIEQTAREVKPDYFEAKPMRGVPFSEFAGAMVGNDKYGKMAAERLEEAGIPAANIHPTDLEHPDQFGYDIYKKFGEHLFQDGGRVEAAGGGAMTKFLRELAEKYRPHYDPSARIAGQPREKWLSQVKLSRPIEEMRVTSQEHRPMVAEQFTSPENYAGKALITGLGDRTPAGYEVTSVNDRILTDPTNMFGGMGFGRDVSSLGPDKAVWGSALTRAQAIANKAKAAADRGYEPIFTYVAQGPESGDFSHHMQDIVLGQLDPRKMDPRLVEKIDKRMREASTGSGETFDPKPDWVGIQSPDAAARMRAKADERVKLIKEMDAAAYRDAPGFADIGASRFATTEPSLMFDPSFSAGKSFMSIDPTGRVITNPVNPHPSYDTFIPAAPGTGHGYLGRLEYELPPELHYKHYLENEIKPELRGKPLDKQTMSLLRQHPTVEATPEWVDTASEWQDLMRSLYGKRSP